MLFALETLIGTHAGDFNFFLICLLIFENCYCLCYERHQNQIRNA